MSSTVLPASSTRTRLTLAVVLTTQLMIVLDAAIVNIALPDMQQALHIAPANLSWVVNAYTLAFGGLLLLGARAGDLFGRRAVFAVGMVLFTVASLLGGFADAGAHLFLARAAQGVGAALVAPSALAILMGLYPKPEDRTRAIGYYTIVSASGAAIGLIAGGLLTNYASWRWVMFVNVPIGLVMLALSRTALPNSRAQHGRIDYAGSLLSTAGMTALVYGFIRAAADGWGSGGALASFAIAVVLLAAFIAVERAVAHPITPLHLFADRERASAYVARMLLVAGSMGAFFFLSQYFQLVLGWSPVRTGLAFVPFPVSVFVSSQLATRIFVPRFGGRAVILVGMVLSAAGLVMLTRLGVDTTYSQLISSMVVFAVGNGTAFVPLTAAGMARVAPQEAGVASGLVNVTQQVGGSVGLAVLVTVFATAGPGAASSPSATGHAKGLFVLGADRGFGVAAALIGAAVVLLLAFRRPRRTPVTVPIEELVLEPAG
ncbi:EmrB/QacA subfamily drug resistance transporter [Phycicoccus badiiscoriae]|uniref:EmrB/QacA subfamily drug resistance transporter n=1 Tax=Pedococcus badiiscoriae TaxID=642776 RepID=A0A852WLP1_9MICO|nr:MFS transporter [Pedococcus badiiscoriae]NYG08531.1 EmrB/QacA subfamily drug resistance transporter [Pedococcus badiiscoriae]